jgi:FADH2 O2-dependent halogenase
MNEPNQSTAHQNNPGQSTPGQHSNRYDVVVLGNHLATALLAAILSRHGIRVAVVPAALDHEMPAGETTVPYTAELFFLLASKFGIDDIARMGMFHDLPEAVRATSGVKQNLGFLYHRPGTAQQPSEALQFNVPGEHAEWHLYRPDVDRYATGLARASGAVVLNVLPTPQGVRINDGGVRVQLEDGELVLAEYLVDGSGDARLLPEGVPGPDGSQLRHRARLLSAHLTGVRPFESIVPLRGYGKASPWSTGTLLHAFDGGWIQVVPFGNHDGARNARCSVTISLDPDRHPDPGAEPSADARQLIRQFPDVQRAFDGAVEARPWRRDDNWPAVAAQPVGPRWFLFDRAAGRHDLLLSRDVTMSLELVHAVATALIDVARSGHWAGDQMKPVGAFQRDLFDFHDRLVAAARIATCDFRLWNAYLRVWLLWSILSALSVKRARLDGEGGTGPQRWSRVEWFDRVAYWYPVPNGLPELVEDVLRDIERVAHGAPAELIAARVFERLRRERFVPPLYRFSDPHARYYHFTRSRRLRMLLWAKTAAPPDFRRLLTMDNITAIPETRSA